MKYQYLISKFTTRQASEMTTYIFCVAFAQKNGHILLKIYLRVRIFETEFVWNIYVNIDYQN